MARHVTNPEEIHKRAVLTVLDYMEFCAQRNSTWKRVREEALPYVKKGATWMQTGAGLSSTAAGIGTGGGALGAVGVPAFSALGHLLGAAGAVAASTPVGLALAGVNAAYHLKAIYSNEWHIRALDAMRKAADADWREWQTSRATLHSLSYALSQKSEKTIRRAAAAIPGVGLIGTCYTLGRALFKKNKGVARKAHAEQLVDAGFAWNGGVYRPDYLAVAACIELLGEADFAYAVKEDSKTLKNLKAGVAQKLRST